MERARYRCAVEHAQLKPPGEITFAKIIDEMTRTRKVAYGQRVELDDEFFFDGEPGSWMDPLNDAAKDAANAAVKKNKRKKVEASNPAPTTALQVPRSGMAGSFSHTPHQVARDVSTDERAPTPTAPRRRAAKAN